MSKASLIVGNGNWAIKDSSLLGYNINDSNIYSPFPFDVTRASAATRVDKDGLIVTDEEIVSGELITVGNDTADIVGLADNSNVNIQTSFLTLSKRYKITFEVYDYVEGAIYILRPYNLGVTNQISSNGTYSYTEIADASTSLIFKTNGTSTTLKLRNISAVEVNQDNLARIDYTDGAKGVLLTEPQSTNLITKSNELASLNSGVVELNSGISPDGTQNAAKVTFGTSQNDGAAIFIGGIAAIANTEHTFSVYAKSLVGDGQFNIRVDTDTQAIVANQNFTATTEWQRYSFQFTTDASSSTFSSNSRIRKSGNPNNEILFYGLQMEKLSYPTSIIPTSGSTVTRNQDLVTNGGEVSTFNSEEGVLYAEIAALSDDLTVRYISLSDGTATNEIYFRYDNISNRIITTITVGGAATASFLTTSYDITNINKIAFKYKENDFSLWVNGVKIAEDTSGSVFPIGTLNNFSFYRGNSTNPFYGKTKNIQVFKKALSDSELQILTTI